MRATLHRTGGVLGGGVANQPAMGPAWQLRAWAGRAAAPPQCSDLTRVSSRVRVLQDWRAQRHAPRLQPSRWVSRLCSGRSSTPAQRSAALCVQRAPPGRCATPPDTNPTSAAPSSPHQHQHTITVKQRIRAIKNIGKITKAMKMVAASKMRNAQVGGEGRLFLFVHAHTSLAGPAPSCSRCRPRPCKRSS